MFTFLNMAKILSWMAMIYMIVTNTSYFMGAVLFYYIVLAVLASIGFFLVMCASHALKSPRASVKAKIDATILLNKLTQETFISIVIPAFISTVLLWMVGLPLLAYSQIGTVVVDLWCKHIAAKK